MGRKEIKMRRLCLNTIPLTSISKNPTLGLTLAVTPILKESRIFNMRIILDTGIISYTIRKTTSLEI